MTSPRQEGAGLQVVTQAFVTGAGSPYDHVDHSQGCLEV